MAFVGRFFDPPAQSYYLFGPRGTGKSAWTQQCYPDSVRIDLLRPATLQRYRARADRLFDLVHAQPDGQVIVIDEAKRCGWRDWCAIWTDSPGSWRRSRSRTARS